MMVVPSIRTVTSGRRKDAECPDPVAQIREQESTVTRSRQKNANDSLSPTRGKCDVFQASRTIRKASMKGESHSHRRGGYPEEESPFSP